MKTLYKALGFMSGTSLDGVDVALLETNGENELKFGATAFHPYTDLERSCLKSALIHAKQIKNASDRDHILSEAEDIVDQAHIRAAQDILRQNPQLQNQIDVVGYHGQTVFHDVSQKLTLQLGRGGVLAEALGFDVVYDFRTQDVFAGGQGAPLVPIYHQALAQKFGLSQPVVFVNIGGVANITYVGDANQLCAFDCGPGNALIDDYMLRHFHQHYDEDGAGAAQGQVHEAYLEALFVQPFFMKSYPKSLDRNEFSAINMDGLSPYDGLATLTMMTAQGILRGLKILPHQPSMVIVVGGGSKNKTMLGFMREHLNCPLKTSDEIGLDAHFVEAQAFAYMAVRNLRGLPISFPQTTGVPHAMSGGVLVRAHANRSF